MKPAEIFNLGVRGVGLLFVYQTIHAIITALSLMSVRGPMGAMGVKPAWSNIILLAVAALWFLFGAPPIQRLAYPDRTREEDSRVPRESPPPRT